MFTIKLFQEYAIHHARWLDGFTAVEAVESIWAWATPFDGFHQTAAQGRY
jgi:hypothetical protein